MQMNKDEAYIFFDSMMTYRELREDLYKMLHCELGETVYANIENLFELFYFWVFSTDKEIDENKYALLAEVYDSEESIDEKFEKMCKIKHKHN